MVPGLSGLSSLHFFTLFPMPAPFLHICARQRAGTPGRGCAHGSSHCRRWWTTTSGDRTAASRGRSATVRTYLLRKRDTTRVSFLQKKIVRQNGDTGVRVLRRANLCLHVYTIKYLNFTILLTHRPVPRPLLLLPLSS